jgi:tRNA pseudouridine55 synthase
MAGFILVDKPSGPTSHDVVDSLRRMTGEKRIGHAGTLDPFASGLLVVGIGREATREFMKLSGLDKRYRAKLRLGATSDTDDRTGNIKNSPNPLFSEEGVNDLKPPFEEGRVGRVLRKFTGKIEQIPPMYSAKKIGGKKLYDLARAGETVERKPSSVEIYSIYEAGYEPPSLEIDVHCSTGTYIRALARDIGETLGCGAYLEELRRTSVGPWRIEEATPLDSLNSLNISDRLRAVEPFLKTVATSKWSC